MPLKEYATANGFAVAQEYIGVEVAKQTDDTAFDEIVANLSTRIRLSA